MGWLGTVQVSVLMAIGGISCVPGGGASGIGRTKEAIGLPANQHLCRLYNESKRSADPVGQRDGPDTQPIRHIRAPEQSEYVMENWSYVYGTTFGYPQTTLNLCTNNQCVSTGSPGHGSRPRRHSPMERWSATPTTGEACPQSTSTTSVGVSAQTVVSKVMRNERGRTTEVDYGNGVVQYHLYNDGTDQRLSQISSSLQWDGPAVYLSV